MYIKSINLNIGGWVGAVGVYVLVLRINIEESRKTLVVAIKSKDLD